MCSELECAVCYQPYNAGRRCPRALRCKHSFCEACLVSLSRGAPDPVIVCPLCRHVTAGAVRAALRVDEGVLEQLLAAGRLDDVAGGAEAGGAEAGGAEAGGAEAGGAEAGGAEAGGAEARRGPAPGASDPSPGSRGWRLRGSWRRMWRKITGSQRHSADCMTNDEFRDLVMMSLYSF